MTNTARIYGDSLYDLSVEEGLSEAILEQMGQLRVLFAQNPDYLRLLAEPSIPLQERQGLLDASIGEGAEPYLVNFLKLLTERGLLLEYAGCCEEFKRRFNQDHGIAEAVVTSAVALSDAQKAKLKAKLEAETGKEISLTYHVDPSVIAGIKVELLGKEIDGTAKGHITGLSRQLQELTI